MQWVFVSIGAIALVAALCLQAARIRDVQHGDITSPPRAIGLGAKIPDRVAGWESRDEPLGATELVRSAIEENLNFDDHVNRFYEKSGTKFGVYVAYWSAGRMPMQKVASHTPDRCWSESGWTCAAMRFPFVLSAPDGPMKPGYWRTFTPPGGGQPTYVLYWHLVGNELYDYGGGFNRRPGIVRWWRDTVRYALSGSSEQYFIRLMSHRPFEELEGDPGFQEMLAALGKLGLSAEKQKN